MTRIDVYRGFRSNAWSVNVWLTRNRAIKVKPSVDRLFSERHVFRNFVIGSYAVVLFGWRKSAQKRSFEQGS